MIHRETWFGPPRCNAQDRQRMRRKTSTRLGVRAHALLRAPMKASNVSVPRAACPLDRARTNIERGICSGVTNVPVNANARAAGPSGYVPIGRRPEAR
jgi:hypothetical protein